MKSRQDSDRPRVGKTYPVTPDGRYFVVKGQLWRKSDPGLAPERREALVRDLMRARRDVGTAVRKRDRAAESDARSRVAAAKRGLGERGPVWWSDEAPDVNRRRVETTVYADWFENLKIPPDEH